MMRFGIYTEMQTPPEKPHYDLVWEIFRQIEHADQMGFDTYSVVEHDFFQKFSISPNPLALFTAVAQRTQRIRFRTAVHTLPLHNPMKLAGEIAEADILTNGRLECGLGRGHPWLFRPAGIPLEESRPRYEEALEILLRAWTQDKFSFAGKFYNVKDVSVVPKPLQKPHPQLYLGGTSEVTYQLAGERGWGVGGGGPAPHTVFIRPLEIYREACAKHGKKPYVFFIRLVYLEEDEKRARQEVEAALRNFLAFNISPFLESFQTEEQKAELRAKGYGFYGSGILESLVTLRYEEIVEHKIAFIGSPEKVSEQIQVLAEEVGGIDEFVIISNFGGLEHWKVIKTQELFARRVIPAFR
jgi:alkanesulfonate monooxygenase SsuD/methylene tetrahydromethanopterin reductase-like flavin-dependent oxidoreductase (luciferase family)